MNLLEKLLVPVLSKLGNFVPGGGIWMNTQRPEWNDANNALVGYGLSMVTLCYLRRYLKLFADLLAEIPPETFPVSVEVLDFFRALGEVLESIRSMLWTGSRARAAQKRSWTGWALSASSYRERVYAGFSGEKSALDTAETPGFHRAGAANIINHSIAANRRPDGLFHSYNLVHFGDARVTKSSICTKCSKVRWPC